MREIDTVLFDLDDTLHHDTTASLSAARSVADALAAERGIDPGSLVDAYEAAAMRFWSSLSAEHLTDTIADQRERMWHEALTALGTDDRALARRCAARYGEARAGTVLELVPGAVEVLAVLRRRGCK